jgi:hypothetical protein
MLPRVGGIIPRAALEALAPRFGWFLYAKAYKPRAAAIEKTA